MAFALTFLLKEVPLRATAGATNPADTYAPTAIPSERTSMQEIERAVEVLARRENQKDLYVRLAARADLPLTPAGCWLLYRLADAPGTTATELGARAGVSGSRLDTQLATLVSDAFIRPPGGHDQPIQLTDQGEAAVARLLQARRDALAEFLRGWSPDDHPELLQLVQTLAGQLLADESRLLRDAQAAAVGA